MEDKVIKLIEVFQQSISSNNIILICTIVSCIIAVFSLIVSGYLWFLQFKDRFLRKKVLGYIYSFYAPTYSFEQLPTTTKIIKEICSFIFKEKDVFNTLIELNKENVNEAVADLSTTLSNVRWKPHMIFANKK